MSLHPRAPKKILSLFLILGLLQHSSARAAPGDIATTTANGLNSAMNGIQSFNTAFGASALEMQQMANQFSGAQNQVNAGATQQSQFDQINQQLQAAMVEAQNCVQKATRTYDKFHKKHKNAANVSADKITSMEPTCRTYGFITDAISVNKERMTDTNKKMACMVNLQNTVNQLAEKAKQPFSQLMTTAGEVYKTHSSIIDSHKKIAEKLKNDLDGPDGKGGYRAQLGRLRSLSLELNNVLNAKKGEKEGLKSGLVKQVDELQTQRASMGNLWYFTLMGEVESCYNSTPQPCFDNSESLPPAQCVVALVANESGKTAGARVRWQTDAKGLAAINRVNMKKAGEKNLPANLDIAKPGEFLSFAKKRFDSTVSGVMANYRNHNFAGNVDKSKISDAINQGYNACWDSAVANFNSDLVSKGPRYYSQITAMKDAERETSNDLKNWIDRVEGDMTEFRTSFHKVYNSELSQFKTDCTADEDPYRSLDCLRVLSATLDSGIKGTRRAIKLGNGSQFVSFAGETQIPMQTLTTDAAGKPTLGTTMASCAGFDDCINYLDRSKAEHEGAAQKGETDRKGFVDTHNSAVRAAFTQVSGAFGQMSSLILNGIKGVNDDLAKIGIKAALKSKDIEGEQLEENKDTGLINMPKSMKAAMAGQNAYTEIDKTDDVTTAYNSLIDQLNKKASEAAKMKGQCKITKADYEGKAALMPKDCSDTKAICAGSKVSQAGISLEELFKRGRNSTEEADRSTISREFATCKRDAISDAKNVTSSEIRRAARRDSINLTKRNDADTADVRDSDAYDEAKETAAAEKTELARDRANQECGDLIFANLDTLSKKARTDGLKTSNDNLTKALRDMSDACARIPIPKKNAPERDATGKVIKEAEESAGRYDSEDEAVTTACEDFKKAAKAGEGPTDEEETKADSDGKSEPATNPLSFPGGGSTAPAK